MTEPIVRFRAFLALAVDQATTEEERRSSAVRACRAIQDLSLHYQTKEEMLETKADLKKAKAKLTELRQEVRRTTNLENQVRLLEKECKSLNADNRMLSVTLARTKEALVDAVKLLRSLQGRVGAGPEEPEPAAHLLQPDAPNWTWASSPGDPREQVVWSSGAAVCLACFGTIKLGDVVRWRKGEGKVHHHCSWDDVLSGEIEVDEWDKNNP